ncbi:MAG: hypothetical protein ABT940_13950 [Alphaproteobacteria bacterium]
MPVDRRVVLFPPHVLLQAVRQHNSQSGQPLPHEIPDQVIFQPAEESALVLRFPSQISVGAEAKPEAGPKEVSFQIPRKDIITALHHWCQHNGVALPRQGARRLESINGRAALMIYADQEASGAGGGTIKTVSLVRTVCGNLPPTTPKVVLLQELWHRSTFCIVDSNTMTRRACRTALIRSGAVHVEECHDENEFLNRYGDGGGKEFHVIIVGALSKVPQEEFLVRIRRTSCPSHFAVSTVITAPIEFAEAKRLREAGFHGILVQPLSIQSVKRVIAHLLTATMQFRVLGDRIRVLPPRLSQSAPKR